MARTLIIALILFIGFASVSQAQTWTGGNATRSNYFWDLVNWYANPATNPPATETSLGVDAWGKTDYKSGGALSGYVSNSLNPTSSTVTFGSGSPSTVNINSSSRTVSTANIEGGWTFNGYWGDPVAGVMTTDYSLHNNLSGATLNFSGDGTLGMYNTSFSFATVTLDNDSRAIGGEWWSALGVPDGRNNTFTVRTNLELDGNINDSRSLTVEGSTDFIANNLSSMSVGGWWTLNTDGADATMSFSNVYTISLQRSGSTSGNRNSLTIGSGGTNAPLFTVGGFSETMPVDGEWTPDLNFGTMSVQGYWTLDGSAGYNIGSLALGGSAAGSDGLSLGDNVAFYAASMTLNGANGGEIDILGSFNNTVMKTARGLTIGGASTNNISLRNLGGSTGGIMFINNPTLNISAQILTDNLIHVTQWGATIDVNRGGQSINTGAADYLHTQYSVFGTYNYGVHQTAGLIEGYGDILLTNGGSTMGATEAQMGNRFVMEPGKILTFGNYEDARFTIANVDNVGASSALNTVRGGAVYLGEGADIDRIRNTNGISNTFGRVNFYSNSADQGAAIYAVQSLTIEGNIEFKDNIAEYAGGAVYMEGKNYVATNPKNNLLLFDTTEGDIVFRNNTSMNDTTPISRSIFLEKNIYVEFNGMQHVYIEDGFDSGATVLDGNNQMEVAFNPVGSGFVQLGTDSDSQFSQASRPGGQVTVNSGAFRVASLQYDNTGEQVTLGNVDEGVFRSYGTGSLFTVNSDGILSGGGIIAASEGFVFSGTVSPDALIYTIPDDLRYGSLNTLPGFSNDIAVMKLEGNVLLDGMTYNIDLAASDLVPPRNNLYNAAYGHSDMLLIGKSQNDGTKVGEVTFGANKNTIVIKAWDNTSDGQYLIMAAQGGIDATNATVMDYFTVEKGDGALRGRQVASLFVESQLAGAVALDNTNNYFWTGNNNDEKDIVLHTSNDGNIYLYWDGTSGYNTWNDDPNAVTNISLRNWYRRGTAADIDAMLATNLVDLKLLGNEERQYFKEGDYVYFVDDSRLKSVTLTLGGANTPQVVSGMEVNSGHFIFTGGEIFGQVTDAGNPYIGVVATGKLVVNGAGTIAEFQNTTSFERGTELGGGGAIGIWRDTSLGGYMTAQNTVDGDKAYGVVSINTTDPAAPNTGTILVKNGVTIRNHFIVNDGQTLIFDSTVTSGAAPSSLTINGVETYDAVRALSIHDGGAIYMGLGSSLERINAEKTTLRLTGNTANRGAGIYVRDSLTLTGNTLIQGNTARELGGGIYMASESIGATLTFDTADGNILLDQNTAAGVANSFYLNSNVVVDFTGSGAVLLNDPFSSGTNSANTMNMNMTPASGKPALVQLSGDNNLNASGAGAVAAGGSVTLNGGTLRLAYDAVAGHGATLNTHGSASAIFAANAGSTIAGGTTLGGAGGTITTPGIFELTNTIISPDSDMFTSKLAAVGAFDRFTVTAAARVGQINFDGQAFALTDSALAIDLLTGTDHLVATNSVNDLVTVNGNVTLSGQIVVGATKLAGYDDTNGNDFLVMTAGKFYGDDGSDDKASLDSYLKQWSGGRVGGRLEFLESVAGSGVFDQLWIIDFQGTASQLLYWTGREGTAWNTTNNNWWDLNADTVFVPGDYVVFDSTFDGSNGTTVDNYTVNVTADQTVAGMEIAASAPGQAFHFTGPGKIIGDNTTGDTGTMYVTGGEAILGVATEFVGGIVMQGDPGGALYIENANALGNYVHATFPADKEGYVDVQGNGTIGVKAGTGAVDSTVTARVNIMPVAPSTSALLTFDVANGETLTFENVVTDNMTDGGAIFIGAGGGIAFAATHEGTLAFTGNLANQGGAIYSVADLTLAPGMSFTNNEAVTNGGGIYAEGHVTLGAGTEFRDNIAGAAGGAIFMAGGTSNATRKNLTFNTLTGDAIVFSDNMAGGFAESVHLADYAGIVINGDGDVDFGDRINASGGNNTLTMNSTGIAYFNGDNVLNAPAAATGAVAINAGTMRLVDGATFSGASTYTLAQGAFLTGNGDITANGGFTMRGTIDLDDGDTSDFGTLNLFGNATFNASTLNFDLTSAGQDLITVDGVVTFATTGGVKNQLNVGNTFDPGVYNIIESTATINNTGNMLTFFDVNIVGLTGRQSYTLALADSLTDTNSILQLNISGGENYVLQWVGDNGPNWDTDDTNENWQRYGTPAQREAFYVSDYVIFDNVGVAQSTVNLNAGSVEVFAMEIRNGNYVFESNDPNATISGVVAGTFADPLTPPPAGFDEAGSLLVDGGTVTLKVATDFEAGIVMQRGALYIGHENALGNDYDSTAVTQSGSVLVQGNSTLGVKAEDGDMDVTARVSVIPSAASARLTFDVAGGVTLTFEGANAGALDGGALFLDTGASLAFAATHQGTIAFMDNAAGQGGAIFTAVDIDLADGTLFTSNRAGTLGGAIYSEGDLTIGTGTTFTDNIAGTSGGAIYMNSSTTLTFETGNVGDVIAFTGNRAAGTLNSVHLNDNVEIDINGAGDVEFNDPLNATGGGNILTMDGTGTVYFTGENYLNQGATAGQADINSGTMRLYGTGANAARFNAGDSVYTLHQGAFLTGRGSMTADEFRLYGTISLDAGAKNAPIGEEIGRLNLAGITTFDGATLEVDLASGNNADSIIVDGQVNFNATGEKNTVTINAFVPGTYKLVESTTNSINLGAGNTIADVFNAVVFRDGTILGNRDAAELRLVDGSAALTESILQLSFTTGKNLALLWSGDQGNTNWNTTDNWRLYYPNQANAESFMVGDYVIFDERTGYPYYAVNVDIQIEEARVYGMEIRNGNYVFQSTLPSATIYGDTTNSNFVDTTGTLFQDGSLLISGGLTTFKLATSFENGIKIDGSINNDVRVTIGHNRALGVYAYGSTRPDPSGVVSVFGNVNVDTDGGDYVISNRFTDESAVIGYEADFTLTVGQGGSLLVDNKNYEDAERGGFIGVQGNVVLNAANGDLTVQNAASADNGGAVYAEKNVTVNGDMNFFTNSALSGGAIYVNGNTFLNGAVSFNENEADDFGGAIYSAGNVTIAAGTTFTDNIAGTAGGAIYMLGGTSNTAMKNLIFNTGGNAIVFSGNTVGGLGDSVHLNNFVNVVVNGTGNVEFDDPINATAGGNTFTMNSTGIAYFTGANFLNRGMDAGRVDINSGIMWLVNNATFDAGNSNYTLHENAMLFGNGEMTATTFLFNGTIALDSGGKDYTASVGTLALNALPGVNAGNTDVTFGGATLVVDLRATGATRADLITVTGDVTFELDASGNKNTVAVNQFVAGTYDLVISNNTIDLFNGTIEDSFNDVVFWGGAEMDNRTGADLRLKTGVTTNSILELTVTSNKNLVLLWRGDQTVNPANWSTTDNWVLYDDNTARDTFQDYDYVVFDATGADTNPVKVDVVRSLSVYAMEILGGNYTFEGDNLNSKIIGLVDGTFDANPPAGFGERGSLLISGGDTTFKVATEFENGITIDGGTAQYGVALVTIGHNKALGDFSTGDSGLVKVLGDVTVATLDDGSYTISNRFTDENAALGADSFTLKVGQDGELIVNNKNLLATTDGGFINVQGEVELDATGGSLTIQNAASAGYGGAIRAGSDVTISGNVTFADNKATGYGGAIYMGYDTDLTFNTGDDENIVFSGNTSDIRSNNNSVYLGGNVDVIINGSGNVHFDDPIDTDFVGNTFTMNSTGTVYFSGFNYLNWGWGSPAGRVDINAGTMRLVNSAYVYTEQSVYTLAKEARLTGNGSISAYGGIEILGTIALDGGTGKEATDAIGSLYLNGNTTFRGATLEVDLSSVDNSADNITVYGIVTFTTTTGGVKNTVTIGDLEGFSSGVRAYDLVISTSDAIGLVNGAIDDTFNAVTYHDGTELGNRVTAELRLKDGDTIDDSILELSIAVGQNLALLWTGDTGHSWNDLETWRLYFDRNTSETFAPGDYVVFDTSGDDSEEVDLSNGNIEVFGMEIRGGNYHFVSTYATGATIIGNTTNSSFSDPTGELAQYGSLLISGGETIFEVATNFQNGITIDGGTAEYGAALVTIGNNKALGDFATDNSGLVKVFGDVTVATLDDGTYAVSNRFTDDFFVTGQKADFTLNIGKNATLNVDNDYTYTYDAGGFIGVQGDVTINATEGTLYVANAASHEAGLVHSGGAVYAGGNVTINGDVDVTDSKVTFYNNFGFRGGAVYAGENVTLDGKIFFENNYAIGSGGAVYAGENVTLGGDVTFTNNGAVDAGGAINAATGSVEIAEGATATFTGNQALNSGGAINAATSVTLDGTTTFTKNIAGNTAGDDTDRGGAINAGTDVTIGGKATFTENEAYNGGAIAALGNVTINGSATDPTQFVGNVATFDSGGAIWAVGDVDVENVEFVGNLAAVHGGAINAAGAVTIGGTTLFDGNMSNQNGGAIFNMQDVTTKVDGEVTFKNNYAINGDGGAIYSYGDVKLAGMIDFTNNTAGGRGGAIYMVGGTSVNDTKTLEILADRGNVTFEGNFDGNGANSIYLEKFTTLSVNAVKVSDDEHYSVNFLDPINAGNGGNSLVKDGTGTVRLAGTGTHVLNRGTVGGTVLINEGYFHLDNVAFETGNSEFTLAKGATLYGNGSISANHFTLQGDVSLGVDRDDIEELMLNGDVTIDGMKWTVTLDRDATLRADLITVSGNVDFGDPSAIVMVDVVTWENGDSYLIMTAADIDATKDDINSHFDVTSGGTELNSRQSATVDLEYNAGLTELWLVIDETKSLMLDWNGKGGDIWDGRENWYEAGTVPPVDSNFVNNDYVRFNNQDEDVKDITVSTDMNIKVSGMEITDGSYTFSGGTIEGTTYVKDANFKPTGRLLVSGATASATFLNDTDFVNGTWIRDGATVVLGSNQSLGAYDATSESDAGLVLTSGGAYVSTVDGKNLTVKNRFVGDTLELTTGTNSTLIVQGVKAPAGQDGGAVNMTQSVTIGSGVSFKENQADNGGAIAAANVRVGNNVGFSGNTAVQSGGAIATTETLTVGTGVQFSDNSADNGGAIAVLQGAATIAGGVQFKDNEAAQSGGAIFLGENATLTFNTIAGEDNDILFIGNTAGSQSNSVFLSGQNEITINGNGDVRFDDPISASDTQGGNSFFMDGTGIVSLSGTNVLNNASLAGGSIEINSGTLRLEDGAQFLGGQSSFLLGQTATLAGDGWIQATEGLTISGTVDLGDSPRDIGELNLIGDTSFGFATLVVDLASGNKSDTINVNGDVSFSQTDKNRVEIQNWTDGLFNLIVSGEEITTFNENLWIVEPTSVRQLADILLSNNEKIVQLKTETINDSLVWKDWKGDGVWDGSAKNWESHYADEDIFLGYDYVNFNGDGTGEVKVVDTGVTTGGMRVKEGNYDFTGGTIRGVAISGDSLRDGAQRIDAGKQTFDVNLDFEGGFFYTGAGTEVELKPGNTMLSDNGPLFVGEGATFTFTPMENGIKVKEVQLNGNIEVLLPNLSTLPDKIENVIQTQTVLDTNRLDAIFDKKTHALIGQETDYASGSKAMHLNYSRITVRDFSEWNGLAWNENEVAIALTDVFNDINLVDNKNFYNLYNEMMSATTNEEILTRLDEMRGSEIATDALGLALWSPWRPIFNHLNQDQYLSPSAMFAGSARDGVLGQLGSRRCSTNGFWLEGFHRSSDVSTDRNARSYTTDRSGVVLGVDRKWHSDTYVGASIHYSNPQLNSRFGKIEADDWGMALYVKQGLTDNLYMNAYIGFGHEEYRYTRNEFGSKLRADYDGNALYTSIELVRPILWQYGVTFLPTIAFDYQKSWVGSFEEKGGLFPKQISKGELESGMFRVGLNSRWRAHELASLDMRLQYGHQVGGSTHGQVDASFVGAPAASPMRLYGVDLGRDMLNVGFGGQVYLTSSRNVYVFGDYDYDVGYKATAHTGQLGFMYLW